MFYLQTSFVKQDLNGIASLTGKWYPFLHKDDTLVTAPTEAAIYKKWKTFREADGSTIEAAPEFIEKQFPDLKYAKLYKITNNKGISFYTAISTADAEHCFVYIFPYEGQYYVEIVNPHNETIQNWLSELDILQIADNPPAAITTYSIGDVYVAGVKGVAAIETKLKDTAPKKVVIESFSRYSKWRDG